MPILLVIPEYAPEDGTVLRAKVKNGRDFMVKLDNSLLNYFRENIFEKARWLKNNFPDGKLLAYYPTEE